MEISECSEGLQAVGMDSALLWYVLPFIDC